MAPDGRMFQASRKGELSELKQGLNGTSMKERKSSLKRTVAAMTLGKDVSSLFTDVVKNTAGDLSMKKLVYLYIINYATSKPDLAILIVNTFIKDAVDPDPLIRALAIRTMALIPLDKITEYLCDPLHAALKDQDPYVRKTAAVCVAKLHETNAALTAQEGFITELQELLNDGNSMVVSNAVASLSEIARVSQTPGILSLTSQTVPRFLSAIAECTEWGQIFILDAISTYTPSDTEEADLMVERIVPRLQHANPAVVLSAVRNIINLMPRLDSDDKRNFLVKKMSAPLITLLSAQPEMQFLALRNITLLVREHPSLLSGDVRVFFASYKDPLYVKIEKLNLLVKLVDPSNLDTVLAELMEYTSDVDVAFSQKAVESIAHIAMQLPAFANKCIDFLSGLIRRKVSHITEHVALMMKDILRVYPDQYGDVVVQLCAAADDVEDPASKAALVWIIGEHAGQIPNSLQILNMIYETIDEETVSVQLQTLTACVKAYLIIGPEAEKLLQSVLSYATEESEHIDVRDRGFIYRRLVDGGIDSAQQVVLSNKQGIDNIQAELPQALQKELLKSLSSIAAVYHKPGKCFEGSRKRTPLGQSFGDTTAEEDLLGIDVEEEQVGNEPTLAITGSSSAAPKGMDESLLDDILGGPVVSDTKALPAPASNEVAPVDDLLSNLGMTGISSAAKVQTTDSRKELLSAANGAGLSIRGGLVQDAAGAFKFDLHLQNNSGVEMKDFAIQFNKNAFGLKPTAPLTLTAPISPGATANAQVPLSSGAQADPGKGMTMQVAIKFTPGGVVYFVDDVSDHVDSVLHRSNSGLLTKPNYMSTWKNVPDSSELKTSITFGEQSSSSAEHISRMLSSKGIFTVAKRMSAKPPVMYLSAVLIGDKHHAILGELTLPLGGGLGTGSIASRSTIADNTLVLESFNGICAKLLAN